MMNDFVRHVTNIAVCLLISSVLFAQQLQKKADFLIAFQSVLTQEGGYVNDKNDRGGETYCGISRKNFPKWVGWATIDKHKMEYNEKLPELNQLVQNFYKTNFWDKIKGNEIINQDVATQLFDESVNIGIKQAVKSTQRVLGITESGIMDNATLKQLNEANNYH